ncbi:cytokine receptor-like isoform X1 [Amphibalanus amphitrite]|uniref:cytokine receptor-like isoform X1 n=1 Tax=Amphibalanus amphitrite TaxID=1232801 RepID=UPI001C90ECE9|nr:cytokine receptor-like isoform X1 [Amphibalanus amphitrite]
MGRRPCLPSALLLLAVTARSVFGLNCLQEGDPGETAPIEVNTEPNQKFRVACYVDPSHPRTEGRTAEDLYFTRDFTGGTGEAKQAFSVVVPDSQAKRYNSTTLVIEDRLETAVHYTYSCRLRSGPDSPVGRRDITLCSSSVNVGYPPLDVKNFSCIVNNWNNITCKWKLQYNAIKSQYQLQYLLKPSYGPLDSPPREQWVRCPLYDYELPEYRTTCSITEKTQPVYRTGATYYNFTMNITNALGTRLQWLGLVNNFAIVLPAAPERVSSAEVTTSSVLLETEVGWPMDSFPRPLDFEVTYTSPWDPQPQSVNASSMSAMPSDQELSLPRPLLVTGLRPYTLYHFSVRMRSSLAESEDLWSEPTTLDVRTLPTVPDAAPAVDQGSFQLIGASTDSRTVLVYWRQIEPWQKNGANFSYCVTATGPTGRSMVPTMTTDAYARFSGVSSGATMFLLASCNAVGRSSQTATLTVPEQRKVGAPPHSVTLRISGPGQYQLFWQHTAGDRTPDSFTLFACEHRSDQPYQCQGQLHLWRVSGDTRQHNISLPFGTEYQFAVSANFAANNETGLPPSSSGMVWSRCSIPFSRDGDQVIQGLSVRTVSARSVTLSWNEDCASQVTVSRVVVIFCRMIGSRCQGEETTREVNRTSPSSVQLTGLRPYTKYRVSLAQLAEDGKQGPRSLPQVAQTLQDRPEPPLGVEVAAATNTSLTVSWRPPLWPNGPMRRYEVRVTGGVTVNVTANVTSVTVTALRPFTEYELTVRACNMIWMSVGCSRPTEPVTGRTLTGVPGEMEPLRTRLLNTSAVLVRWRPPLEPGGPQLVYYLRTVSEVDGVNYTQPDTEMTGDQLEAEEQLAHACRSGARSQRHLFWVRAGTVLPSGEVLLGAWSEPAEQNCVLTSEWPLAAVLGLVAGGLLLMALAVLVFCLCSRTKRKWVKMRDIGVNLPSGLERPDKGLHGFRSSDTRSGPVSAGYGRLVSQTGESGGTSGRPLLQEEAVPVGTTGLSEDTLPSTATDSNSCSSGATNYTDSGAESEKVGSPTYERLPWPAGSPHLAPYVQAGGPGSPPSGAPVYPQFSPYVDATAIQSLLAGGGVSALPKDSGEPAQVSRSEPDLSSASAAVQGPSLPYSRVGLRSSAGYVSMTSDEALPPPPPPAEKVPPPEQPYVALGPTPPASSAAGFPPYVLAGLSAEDCEPYTVQPSQSYTPAAQPARSSAYVTHDKLQPAGIELRDMSAADASPDDESDSAEPVLSPKKLATVVSAREPYCRVVTQHQAAADLGPNVSMV